MKIEFEIEDINGDIYFTNDLSNYPVVIVSHGFKGWKDWGFLPYLAEQISLRNALAITFNYSHNGKPDETGFLTDIENFAGNSIACEIGDLQFLVNSLEKNLLQISEEVFSEWNGEIYLVGHSLGAGISLIAGSEMEVVKKIVLLASVGIFDRYTFRQKRLWERQGFIEFPNQTTNQILKLNYEFLEDLETHKSDYDLLKIISEISKPVLMIHGEQDFTVPLKEILPMMNANNNFVRSKVIPRTGHTFGIVHPFETASNELKEILEIISEFLQLK